MGLHCYFKGKYEKKEYALFYLEMYAHGSVLSGKLNDVVHAKPHLID